jgi:hypothetical protein
MEPLLVNPHELRHPEQLDRHYGNVPNRGGVVLVMLDHLNKPELKTTIEDWTYVFKDRMLRSGVQTIPETKELENIELIVNRNPDIREFIQCIDVNNLPNEVWDRYMRVIHYYNTTIIDIEEKGIEKGIEKGKREGNKEGLLKAVRVLKELKTMSHDEIAIKLDLTEADVSWIKID